jgi:hypothetical protein
MDHQTYICYHGDQYSFLQHILPENKVIPPLDQRPTIKAQSRHDVRDLTFVDSHENLVMNRMFNVRGSAPYSLYANAVDQSPETIKEQYQLDKNRLRFHNHTRSAKYQ